MRGRLTFTRIANPISYEYADFTDSQLFKEWIRKLLDLWKRSVIETGLKFPSLKLYSRGKSEVTGRRGPFCFFL